MNLERKPLFDGKEEMIKQGYLWQWPYEEKDYGHGFYETPFARIDRYILKEDIDFISTDGAAWANEKIVITLK